MTVGLMEQRVAGMYNVVDFLFAFLILFLFFKKEEERKKKRKRKKRIDCTFISGTGYR